MTLDNPYRALTGPYPYLIPTPTPNPSPKQVVFGEYCEMGACCLKWEDGPPQIWRAALDFALC